MALSMRNCYHIPFIRFFPLSANHVPHILPKGCSEEHLAKRFTVQNAHLFLQINEFLINLTDDWFNYVFSSGSATYNSTCFL